MTMRAHLGRGDRRVAVLAMSMALGAVVAATAEANIVWTLDGFNFSYGYKVSQMPDFDQLRTAGAGVPGLPNGGQSYCAPTALTNAAAYVNFHGYPQVMPVLSQTWGQWLQYGPTQYSLSNIGIELAAGSLSTSPTTGTTQANLLAGAKAIFPPDLFTIDYVLTSPQTPILPLTMFAAAVDCPFPSLILPVVGFYQTGRGTELVRVGGHVVTLTYVEENPSLRAIGFSDSSATGNDSVFAQSAFVEEYYPVSVADKKINGVTRKMASVDYYTSNAAQGWLDGYLRITPTYGLITKPTLTTFVFVKPVAFEYLGGGDSNVVVSTTALFDADLSPTSGKVAFVTKPSGLPGKLMFYSSASQSSQDSGVSLVDPKKVTTGRRGEIYVLDGQQTVRCITLSATGGLPTVINIGVAIKLADIAYDDFNDRLVGLSADSKLLWFRPYCTNPDLCPTSTSALPESVPAMNAASTSMDIDPTNGRIWFTASNLTSLYGLIVDTELATISRADVVNPKGIAIDNAGNVLFESNGVIRAYAPGLDGYVANPQHVMAGKIGGGGIVVMPRARTNFDPAQYAGPTWNTNVLPTTFGSPLVPCDADLNLDHVVSGPDIALLLGQWGSDGSADFNDDDVVDALDLAVLLGEWGACN